MSAGEVTSKGRKGEVCEMKRGLRCMVIWNGEGWKYLIYWSWMAWGVSGPDSHLCARARRGSAVMAKEAAMKRFGTDGLWTHRFKNRGIKWLGILSWNILQSLGDREQESKAGLDLKRNLCSRMGSRWAEIF